MNETEGRVVFNYLAEEINTEEETGKQDDSCDENQNSKVPKSHGNRKYNSGETSHTKDTSPPQKKKKMVFGKRVNSKSAFEGTKNGVKTLINKKPEICLLNGNLNESSANGDICLRKVIKLETAEEEALMNNDPEIGCNAPSECENIDIKDEPFDETTVKLKCEPPEENVKKKKNITKKENILDSLYREIDLKPKCKSTKSIFKCNSCLYVGKSKGNLERHALIHMDPNDILWYKCSDCDYKSKYEAQLKGHMLIHKSPDEKEYFQCPHCEQKCTRKHNLTNHIRTMHHDRINTFKCAECEYTTFSKDRLAAHVKRHSNELFTCHMCKFVTKREEYLQTHFKFKHTDLEKPYPCDTCSYKGKTKRELDRHYSRMHNKDQLKAYQCSHCEFSSIYKKNLEYHLLHMHKNSEGFQKYICGHCEKEFAYKNGLKVHIVRMHLKLTDEDWQKCQECKYKTKDVSTLKRHIKRNHGAPRLLCNQCDFATNRSNSMEAHLKSHQVEDDEILKCPLCPYRFTQATSFFYHMRVIHGKPIASKDVSKYYLKGE
ncbi:zinc finger protein 711-like [Euwallacea similis]|uniref:zinc finger protein 711-like n=1 Tax=Euwallacea similis TaxID=1736056 RepID=UPI003450781D